MNQSQLLPYDGPFMKRLIGGTIFTMRYRQIDEMLVLEIRQLLNESLAPVYGEDFEVFGFHSNGSIEVTYNQGGVKQYVTVTVDDIEAGEMSAKEEFDRRLTQCASAMYELVELGKRINDKRLMALANTQFELGFMTLRKSTQEQSDESY